GWGGRRRAGRWGPSRVRRARGAGLRGPWSAHPSAVAPQSGGGWEGGGWLCGRAMHAVPEVLVGRRGLVQRERRPAEERLDPHGAALDVADRTQRAPAGIGVEDDLALDGAGGEDLLGERLPGPVRPLHPPVLWDAEVGVD